jgi:hypothetical protein
MPIRINVPRIDFPAFLKDIEVSKPEIFNPNLEDHLKFMRSIVMNFPNERVAGIEWMKFLGKCNHDYALSYNYVRFAYAGINVTGSISLNHPLLYADNKSGCYYSSNLEKSSDSVVVSRAANYSNEFFTFAAGMLPFKREITYTKDGKVAGEITDYTSWESVDDWAIIIAVRLILDRRYSNYYWIQKCREMPIDD